MNRLPDVLGLAALVVATFAGCTKQKDEFHMELPSSPSEDVSDLLVKPASASDDFDFDAKRDYLPDPKVEWTVTFEFEEPVFRNKIEDILDIPWLNAHGRPTIYGFSTDEKRWTFVSAADSPEEFSSLKVAWRLWNSLDDKPEELWQDDLERYRVAAEEVLAPLGKYTTKIERSGDDVLNYVASLTDLVAECDKDVSLILVAPEGRAFSGRDVWDVMLCLGLEYGDGDLFHWNNNSSVGDDQFFTVETSTSPGYFIPQWIASGGGNVDDLIFYFSIPRSADPIAVFESMANAVEYAQRRLGGKTVLQSGEPFSKEAERAKIERTVQRLKEAGFVPGESSTLRVF